MLRSIIADLDGKEKGDGSIPDEDFSQILANTAGPAESSILFILSYYTTVRLKREVLLHMYIGNPNVNINATLLFSGIKARCESCIRHLLDNSAYRVDK